MAPCTVLMVAEKPSLAASIAQLLSNGKSWSRRGALEVHEYDSTFQGQLAHFKVTSVIGHVFSLDFPSSYNNWETTDPLTLFDAQPVKNEANPKAHVCRHLQTEAKGCDILVLWLDCDREGENICFEVLENTLRWLRQPTMQNVHRARFSAITAPEIRAALNNLTKPNKNEALAVDARQELDLKVGVAFTRFQTRYFQGKYGNLDATVISYGPCQTPTLNFCVERHQAIISFQPEMFWVVQPVISKSGCKLELEWERGRLFDQQIASLYLNLVKEGKKVKVTDVKESEERKQRPHGLNTVELLKVASASLGIGPHQAMQVAERLYTSGYVSYPRTESTAYPPNFDIKGTLAAQRSHPVWGEYASAIYNAGLPHPKGGTDVGDHPPITPVRAATLDELTGESWSIYDYITRHFLGSVSPDAVYKRTKATFTCGGETFTLAGSVPVKPGFTAIMTWKAVQGDPIPNFTVGEQLPLTDTTLHQSKTSPPDYLSESELIGLMEKHGIGTDASIPTHINNICERNYVQIQNGRRVVPTELGITLIKGYQLIDPELCLPQVRAHVEKQINLIAHGQADITAVVEHTLEQFKNKFKFFVAKIVRMDSLFEASFSPLSASGKPLCKCGKCGRYMKHISARPMRLYCGCCEEVYALPQGGAIKLYKGIQCPLDGFELLLFSLAGRDGRTYPLCPYCYNHPPFEGVTKIGGDIPGKAAMPCTICPHPTCANSPARMGVTACPQPGCTGMLVLDPVSAPKWRLDCSRCSFLIYLPKDLHAVKVVKSLCEECNSKQLQLEWKKGSSPLTGGETSYTACIACDELVRPLCEIKHGQTFFKRGSRGGRSRGRGRGRGRGRKLPKDYDPKMSFSDF